VKLLSLSAENYRTLQNILLTFSSNYCAISGKNNAGKSSVIRLLSILFRRGDRYPWEPYENTLDYKEDRTQWIKTPAPIVIEYGLKLSKTDDPALIAFIEIISKTPFTTDCVDLLVRYELTNNDDLRIAVTVNETPVDEKSAKEIQKKIRDSDLLFLYNSTTPQERYYYGRGRRRMFYDFVMSEEERKTLDVATKTIERRFRKLARAHKTGLNTILERLSDRYDVEFSQPEEYSTRHMPLGISLKDRHVEVPLGDWGSGTQNRTHILMAVLQANRIRTTASPDDKITPILVIEEPESFLHPSAQSEFGAMLSALSLEFCIQTVVTTHSPYMLNRDEPASNILLHRDFRKMKGRETRVVDTSGDAWMTPFAEHLGIPPEEFASWRPLFSAYRSRVLLVEGRLDQEYFEFFQGDTTSPCGLDRDIVVVPYGGKDVLKHTLLVKFVLEKFDDVYVTYDLDADLDVRTALSRLGLKEKSDFLPLGLQKPGKDSIEGLLPERVLSAVNGRETALVMSLRSHNSKERKAAKDELKKKYLAEFKSHSDYTNDELKELALVLKVINARLASPNNGMQRAPRKTRRR
jgi:AAA15 family ATPase/GTPase